MNNEEWVEFAKKDPVEAEIIRGKLEAYGIEVYLKQDAFGKSSVPTSTFWRAWNMRRESDRI